MKPHPGQANRRAAGTTLGLVLAVLAVLVPGLLQSTSGRPMVAEHGTHEMKADAGKGDCRSHPQQHPADCETCPLHCSTVLGVSSAPVAIVVVGPSFVRLEGKAPAAIAAPVRFRPPITAA